MKRAGTRQSREHKQQEPAQSREASDRGGDTWMEKCAEHLHKPEAAPACPRHQHSTPTFVSSCCHAVSSDSHGGGHARRRACAMACQKVRCVGVGCEEGLACAPGIRSDWHVARVRIVQIPALFRIGREAVRRAARCQQAADRRVRQHCTAHIRTCCGPTRSTLDHMTA